MPRYGGGFATAPEDPAYYEALAGGSDAGIGEEIFDSAVAGVAAPLILRKQRNEASALADKREQLAKALYKAILAQGEKEEVAAAIALEMARTGEAKLREALADTQKTINEFKLNEANIGLKETEGQENLATAGKATAETAEIPATAEADRYSTRTTADASTVTAKAASTNAVANLRDKAAQAQGKTREQLFAEFQYFDKNGDGQISREEAEKARMKEREAVRKEMEEINSQWDQYDAMTESQKAGTPPPESPRISPEDIATEADNRAEKYLNDLNSIRLTNNDFLGRIGNKPLGGSPADSAGTKSATDSTGTGQPDHPDTLGALGEIGKFAGQKPTDPEGLIAYLKGKYPKMDEVRVRAKLGI